MQCKVEFISSQQNSVSLVWVAAAALIVKGKIIKKGREENTIISLIATRIVRGFNCLG